MTKTHKLFYRLALTAAILTYILIVVGGVVRVTGSGLGCPDWPTCEGRWFPPPRQDAIIEYSHRAVAGITSLAILATTIVAWRSYRQTKFITTPLVVSLFLLAFQIVLGGIVVYYELPGNLVAIHLGNSLVILAIMILAAVATAGNEFPAPTKKLNFTSPLNRSILWTTILMYLVIISGAYVAGSNSTFGCGGWPLCNGQLIPVSPQGWIHMFHRLFVLVVSVMVVRNYSKVRNESENPKVSSWSTAAVILFFIQALVGALKTTYGFPILLLGLHVAVAAAVWGTQVVAAAYAGLDGS